MTKRSHSISLVRFNLKQEFICFFAALLTELLISLYSCDMNPFLSSKNLRVFLARASCTECIDPRPEVLRQALEQPIEAEPQTLYPDKLNGARCKP
jgi:hypothetical protein